MQHSAKTDRARISCVLILASTLALLPQLPAQEEDPILMKLARAQMVEAAEKDLPQAINLYRELTELEEIDPEIRSRAYLHLGLALQKVGETEAASQALAQAASGVGQAAVEARNYQDPKEEGFIEGKVLQLIAELKQQVFEYSDDLVWMGKPALPLLIRAVDAEELDLNFVTSGSATLFRIAGEPVEAWMSAVLKNYSVLKKRAVIRGARKIKSGIPGFEGLIRDPDPEVRRDALRQSGRFPFLTRVELLDDPDARVRDAAVDAIGLPSEDDADYFSGLSRLIEVLEDSEHPACAKLLASDHVILHYRQQRVVTTSEGREAFLRSLLLPTSAAEGMNYSLTFTASPNEHIGLVVRVAKHLGRYETNVWKKRFLYSYVEQSSPSWNLDAFDQGMLISALGYTVNGSWLDEPISIAAGRKMLAYLDSLNWSQREFVLESLQPEDVGENLKSLRDWSMAALQRDDSANQDRDSLDAAVSLIGSIGTKESCEAAKELHLAIPRMISNSNREKRLISRLIDRFDTDNETIRQSLRDLISLSGGNSETALHAAMQLYSLGDEPAIAEYSKGYALGHRLGLMSRLINKPGKYDVSQTTAIITDCLANGGAAAWEELTSYARGIGGVWSVVRADYRIAVITSLQKAPANDLTQILGMLVNRAYTFPNLSAEEKAVLIDLLNHPVTLVRDRALDALQGQIESGENLTPILVPLLKSDDRQVVARAIALLGDSGDTKALDAVKAQASHESEEVRVEVVQSIGDLANDNAAELLEPFLQDPSNRVRLQLVQVIGNSLEWRAAAPILVEALKDRDAQVRNVSQQILGTLRSNYEERERWTRILQDSDKDPMDALITQAREGKTKAIQIAAITSIGTFGKPESLPMLIELMGSEDSEIAEAAAAAVTKINSK
ncbi:MAG: HEAT repeat domain-containing protein [Planctomycetota bacterium]|jgi:HEAT repeat protein